MATLLLATSDPLPWLLPRDPFLPWAPSMRQRKTMVGFHREWVHLWREPGWCASSFSIFGRAILNVYRSAVRRRLHGRMFPSQCHVSIPLSLFPSVAPPSGASPSSSFRSSASPTTVFFPTTEQSTGVASCWPWVPWSSGISIPNHFRFSSGRCTSLLGFIPDLVLMAYWASLLKGKWVRWSRDTQNQCENTLHAHSLPQSYKSCLIMGNEDFIFGNSSAILWILVRPRQVMPEKGVPWSGDFPKTLSSFIYGIWKIVVVDEALQLIKQMKGRAHLLHVPHTQYRLMGFVMTRGLMKNLGS